MAPIRIRPVAPIGTRPASGFVDYADGHGAFESWEEPVYPPSPDGAALHAKRLSLDMSLRECAKLLGMKAVDLSSLEWGRAAFEEGAFEEAMRRIEAAPHREGGER